MNFSDTTNYKITRSQIVEDYKIMIPKMKKDQEVQDIQEMESGDSQEEIEEILSQVNIYLGLLGLHLSLSYSLGLHLSLSYFTRVTLYLCHIL